MTADREGHGVPDGLEDVTPGEFRELDTDELDVLRTYVDELLDERDAAAVELGLGDEEVLTRVVSRGGYLEVHKRVPCAPGCDSCPHGPYVYHVRREPRPEGGSHLHWSLIGPEVADSN